MMKGMMTYHDESQKAVTQGVTWNKIREVTSDIAYQLRSMKFEIPDDGKDVIEAKYEKLLQNMMEKFASVIDD